MMTRRLPGLGGVVLAVALAAGCGLVGETTPPPSLSAQPITSVAAVAGAWTGVGRPAGSGSSPMSLVITPNGAYRASGPGAGAVLVEGQARLAGTALVLESALGRAGTATLYEGGGRRILRVTLDDGTVVAELEPKR
jgi:hypothetical protein